MSMVFIFNFFSIMYDKIAKDCLTAFKHFHEMIIDILMQSDTADEQSEILYSEAFLDLLKESMG